MTPDLDANDPLTADERALLARYYANACDAPMRIRAEALLARHPHAQRFATALTRVIEESTATVTPDDADRALSTALSTWKARRMPSSVPSHARVTGRPRPMWLSRGAVLGGMAVLGIVAAGLAVRAGLNADNETYTYRTAVGERTTVHLPDGPTLILAPATAVTVAAAGAGVAVDVVGEVFVTVPGRAAHPVSVRTRNAVVRVLGTQFTVRQYPEEPVSRVVVATGRVALTPALSAQASVGRRGAWGSMVLNARMRALVSDSGVTAVSDIASDKDMGWTHGALVFDRVALREALADVGRAYGVPMRVDDAVLGSRPLVLDVDLARDSFAKILDVICLAMQAHYVRDGRTFVLKPGGATGSRAPDRSFPQMERQYGK